MASILEDNYISTWLLLDDIKAIIADFSKSKTNAKTLSEKAKTEARLAEAILSAYQFPVETMVYTPDGDLIWRMNSNVNFHGKFKFNRDSTTGDMFVDDIGMKKTITEADYGGITLAGTGEHEMTKETQNKYAQLKIQEFRALVPPKAGTSQLAHVLHVPAKPHTANGRRSFVLHCSLDPVLQASCTRNFCTNSCKPER